MVAAMVIVMTIILLWDDLIGATHEKEVHVRSGQH